MNVVICENELEHRTYISSVIKKYAMFHEPSIELVLSATRAEEVLAYACDNKVDCYFLDIELDSSLSGMDLASMIRKHDPLANIIFISMHADKLKLTFKYKLAALDFIVKDEAQDEMTIQIEEALQAAFRKYEQVGRSANANVLQIEIGNRVANINYDDIYYLETSSQPHKIRLHKKNGDYEFYGRMKDFTEIDERFFQCHKSYIVNLQHIKYIDKTKREITMVDGGVCYLAFRKIKELEKKIIKRHESVI